MPSMPLSGLHTGPQSVQDFTALLTQVRGCTLCAAYLPLGPRPIVQLAQSARLVIIGQAPGEVAWRIWTGR